MGRFHRHTDGAGHTYTHEHDQDHDHEHEDGHEHGSRDVGDHSGYTETGTTRVSVLESLLSENDRVADANRTDLRGHGVRAVNLMSSPGAGKTLLLARTLAALGDELAVGVLEGDIATSLDADRLEGLGAAVALVNTSAGFGGECHLDAVMVRSGLGRLPLDAIDLLLIENVGNLVCPAVYDLGQAANVVALSVTEGEDKPLKYPTMFRGADLVVLTKTDLIPHLDFNLQALKDGLARVMPVPTMIEVSAKTGAGIEQWVQWLEARRPKPGAHVHHDHEHHHHDHDHHHHEHDHGHHHGHRS